MRIINRHINLKLAIICFTLISIFVQPLLSSDTSDDLYWQRKFIEYLRKFEIHFDRTDGNYATQHFIESYAVRAMLIAYDNYTNDNYDLNYAIRWTDRMLSAQGKTLHPGEHSMGYDETGYERPLGWYPADCCCIGNLTTHLV